MADKLLGLVAAKEDGYDRLTDRIPDLGTGRALWCGQLATLRPGAEVRAARGASLGKHAWVGVERAKA